MKERIDENHPWVSDDGTTSAAHKLFHSLHWELAKYENLIVTQQLHKGNLC